MIAKKIKSMNWKDRIFWGLATLHIVALLAIGVLQWDVSRNITEMNAKVAAWEAEFSSGETGGGTND